MVEAEHAVRPEEVLMHHASSHRVKGTTRRSPRPSISPYLIEEIELTLTDIRRAQVAEFDSASVAS